MVHSAANRVITPSTAPRGPILPGVAPGICQFYGIEDVTGSYWGVMRAYGMVQGITGVLQEPSGV